MDGPRDPTDVGQQLESPIAGLHESQQYRVSREINNAIISNLTRESLFHAITEAVRKVVPFDRAVLPIYDAEKGVFRRFALEGRSLPGPPSPGAWRKEKRGNGPTPLQAKN